MRYVFHLGVHKTAVTFLQRNLSENLEVLRAQRVFYVNEEFPTAIKRQRKVLKAFRDPERETPPLDALAETNATIVRAARAQKAEIVLLSEENRLGPPMHQELNWNVLNPSFYPEAQTCLRYVAYGFPLGRMRLLLFSRDPASYLVSLYVEAVRHAQTNLTLEEFCRAVNFNSIDFGGLVERLQSLHNSLDIKMRQYERIKLGPETYLRTFLRDIGLDPSPFALHTTPVRPQLDATQIEALLHISAGGQSKRWRLVKRLRDQVLAGAPNPEARITLPDWVTESMRVTADGRDSNAA